MAAEEGGDKRWVKEVSLRDNICGFGAAVTEESPDEVWFLLKGYCNIYNFIFKIIL